MDFEKGSKKFQKAFIEAKRNNEVRSMAGKPEINEYLGWKHKELERKREILGGGEGRTEALE